MRYCFHSPMIDFPCMLFIRAWFTGKRKGFLLHPCWPITRYFFRKGGRTIEVRRCTYRHSRDRISFFRTGRVIHQETFVRVCFSSDCEASGFLYLRRYIENREANLYVSTGIRACCACGKSWSYFTLPSFFQHLSDRRFLQTRNSCYIHSYIMICFIYLARKSYGGWAAKIPYPRGLDDSICATHPWSR
jgi:hypothetical protein